jgi:putative MATE family efflux protein
MWEEAGMSRTGNLVARRTRDVSGLLRAAVRGEGGNPTVGSIPRAIVLLAVPMVLEMVMESVFAVVDIYFVSRLGANAMAAVGITESLFTVVYTAGVGLSIGVTAVVARRIGERNREAASDAAFQALVIGVLVAIVLGVFGAWHAEALLRLMGADEAVVAMGAGYARVMFGGNAAVMLLFLLNAAFRGAGDAAIAMRVLVVANGINIVLDPMLIFGIGPFPEMGVTGAAVATTIGRSVGVVLQLAVLFGGAGALQRFGGAGALKLSSRNLRVAPAEMMRLLRLSGTGTLQVFISVASWILLMRIVAGFGSPAVAGYTIAIRVVLFALMPAWGLANAAATMVGQSLGAGDASRAERAVWIAGGMNLVFLGSVGVLFMIAAPLIVGIFGGDIETSRHAINCLRIVSAGFFFYAYGMVINQSFNGAGDAWTPTLLNLLCFWFWEIPLAWLLAYRIGFGAMGTFMAVTIAFSTLALASAVMFRRGKWKLKVV